MNPEDSNFIILIILGFWIRSGILLVFPDFFAVFGELRVLSGGGLVA